eukprot:6182063-Pleurochrysis_carterae.AAC.2
MVNAANKCTGGAGVCMAKKRVRSVLERTGEREALAHGCGGGEGAGKGVEARCAHNAREERDAFDRSAGAARDDARPDLDLLPAPQHALQNGAACRTHTKERRGVRRAAPAKKEHCASSLLLRCRLQFWSFLSKGRACALKAFARFKTGRSRVLLKGVEGRDTRCGGKKQKQRCARRGSPGTGPVVARRGPSPRDLMRRAPVLDSTRQRVASAISAGARKRPRGGRVALL